MAPQTRSNAEQASSAEHRLLMIDSEWSAFLVAADDEQGMDPEEYERRLQGLLDSSADSLDRACRIWRQLEGQDKVLKEEQDRLGEKRKRAQAHIAAIKDHMLSVVKRVGGKVQTLQNSLTVQTTKGTVKLKEGYEVKEEIGRRSELTYVAALGAALFQSDPERAAALGLYEHKTEYVLRK